MQTKRCSYCHKLQRADARLCRSCGHSFETLQKQFSTIETTAPSLPSASPHLAGHYAGLHPEDQPYQSAKLRIRRPAAFSFQNELSDPDNALSDPEILSVVEAPRSSVWERIQHIWHRKNQQNLNTNSGFITSSTWSFTRIPTPLHFTYVIIALSCFIFLLASSIIAFVQIGNRRVSAHASLMAIPATVHVQETFQLSGQDLGKHDLLLITYDGTLPLLSTTGQPLQVYTDDQGAFKLQIVAPQSWSVGTHTIHARDQARQDVTSTTVTLQATQSTTLQIGSTSLDFGSASAGEAAQNLTLTASPQGTITWQAQSDQPWLTPQPDHGTFTDNQVIQIHINRDNLATQNYTGHISFAHVQPAGQATSPIDQPALQLTATMQVIAPGNLSISTTFLQYSAIVGAQSGLQQVVIQNSGGEGVDWTSTISTDDGNPWLTLSPPRGYLSPNTSAILMANVNAQVLTAGNYSGLITFSGAGTILPVHVSLTILAPGKLTITPPALTFQTTITQPVNAQTVTLKNTGDLTLNWSATVSTDDQGTWLQINKESGTLNGGKQVDVQIAIDTSTLKAGHYHGTVLFQAGSLNQRVDITLIISEVPTSTPTPTTPVATVTATPSPVTK